MPEGTGPMRDRSAEGGVWRFGPLAVALLDAGADNCVLHGLAAREAARGDRRALVAGLWALVRRLEGQA